MKYQVRENKKEIKNTDVVGDYKDVRIYDSMLEYYSNNVSENQEYKLTRSKYVNFIRKHLISIVFLFIILLFNLNLNFCFINLEVNSSSIPKEEIEKLKNDLAEYYYSTFIFKYLKNDVNDINDNLKIKYYEYEFFNVYKKGINLYVDIRAKDDLKTEETDNTVGDLYASQSGIVHSSFIQKGVLLVKNNYYVHKDDLLVSGNLKYNINKVEYVKAKGIVIACTFDVLDKKIEKFKTELVRSGKIEIFELYKFQNSNIKSKFEIYETEIIEGKNFFSKNKIIVYELIEKREAYDYDDALKYATSMIKSEFKENVVHKDEKILDIILFKNSEDEGNYYFTFLVKALKNIAYFKEYKEE